MSDWIKRKTGPTTYLFCSVIESLTVDCLRNMWNSPPTTLNHPLWHSLMHVLSSAFLSNNNISRRINIIIICDRGNEHSTEDGLIILIASGLNISINLIILWKTVFTNHMLFAHIGNCIGLIAIHDINKYCLVEGY